MMPTLETERLVLRPFRLDDAGAVAMHVGNWKVARMLSRVPHPYSRAMAEEWIASQDADWQSGEEITFCIELEGEAAGSISLRRREERVYILGYWLGEPWWGTGYATEAARCTVHFAFEELGAEKLTARHFLDNPASGRVLEKCGFRYTGEGTEHSIARGAAATHRDLECGRAEFESRVKAS
jgi:ribosomal-protein-alanine N-acetyltransferase